MLSTKNAIHMCRLTVRRIALKDDLRRCIATLLHLGVVDVVAGDYCQPETDMFFRYVERVVCIR